MVMVNNASVTMMASLQAGWRGLCGAQLPTAAAMLQLLQSCSVSWTASGVCCAERCMYSEKNGRMPSDGITQLQAVKQVGLVLISLCYHHAKPDMVLCKHSVLLHLLESCIPQSARCRTFKVARVWQMLACPQTLVLPLAYMHASEVQSCMCL